MVLLFGDDFQLVSVSNNGAINGYVKRSVGVEQHVTDKMIYAQSF